ncbi:MAG: PAS domain-containing sensor histidine kinase [Psychromonas sp.]|nr:PAS domain-containing sensor histidine kinase [Psychromonas sp.]
MNALIENTLQIIAKVSSSKKGYLLQLTDQGYKVLTIWGGANEEFKHLNDLLFSFYKTGSIDTEKVINLPSISDFVKEKSLSSFFINELNYFSERNLYIYILLFSYEEDEYTDVCKTRILSILSILSQQIRDWFENKTERLLSSYSEDTLEGEKISNEWEEKFNTLIKTSPDLIILLDDSGKINLINRTGKDILEYSPEDLKGKHFLELVEKEDSSAVTNSLNRALSDKKQIKFRTHLCSLSGQVFPFEFSCSTITGNGKVLGLIGIGKNITEKLKYEKELQSLKPKLIERERLLNLERARFEQQKSVIEELNRLKYDFISSVSHEFRTTLASIIGFSETIESDKDLSDSMKKEFNRVIMSEGKRLAKLINYLLDNSSLEDRLILINITNVEVLKLVQGVIDANYESAYIKNITVTFEHPSEEIIIEADRENLYQVISALLNNAIRFTGEFGRVKIIVNNLYNEVEIIVSDTGIGIPERDQPYLFQRFFRVSRRMSEMPSIGVGLVFVKQIIDSHKGLITVQSEVGSGTTFVVKLPKRSKIEKNEVKI